MEHLKEKEGSKLEKCSDSGKTKESVDSLCDKGNRVENSSIGSELINEKENSKGHCEVNKETTLVTSSVNSLSNVKTTDTTEEPEKPDVLGKLNESPTPRISPSIGTHVDNELVHEGCSSLPVSESAIRKNLDSREESSADSKTDDTDKVSLGKGESSDPLCSNENHSKCCEEKIQEELHEGAIEEGSCPNSPCETQDESCQSVSESEIVKSHTVESINQNCSELGDNHDVEKDSKCSKSNSEVNKPLHEKSGDEKGCRIQDDASSIQDDSAVEGEGCAIEVEGYAVEGKGSSVEEEGITVEGEGIAVEGERISVEEEEEESAVAREESTVEGAGIAVERKESEVEREESAVESWESAVDREESAVEREESAVEREESAVEREESAVEKEESAVDREESAVEREGSTVEEEGSAVDEEENSVNEGQSAVEGGGSADEGEQKAVEVGESLVQNGDAVQEDENANHGNEDSIHGHGSSTKDDENINEHVLNDPNEKADEESLNVVVEDSRETGMYNESESNGEDNSHITNTQSEMEDNVKENCDLQAKEKTRNQSTVVISERVTVEQDSSVENILSVKSPNEIEHSARDDRSDSSVSREASVLETNSSRVQSNEASNKERDLDDDDDDDDDAVAAADDYDDDDDDDERSSETEKLDLAKNCESTSQMLEDALTDNPNEKLSVDDQINNCNDAEEEDCEDELGKPIDDASEEASKETEKDNLESFNEARDTVEFVQIDSDDKDEDSQQSLDGTQEGDSEAVDEDPIAVSNEHNKDDDLMIAQENNEQEMDVENSIDIVKDNFPASNLETSASIEETVNVDISEMCETVLEESSARVQSKKLSKESGTGQPSTIVSENDNATDLVLDPSEPVEENVKQGDTRKMSVLAKTTNENTKTNVDLPCEAITADKPPGDMLPAPDDDDDEEICIIPDTVPRVVTGQANSEQTKLKTVSGGKVSDMEDISTAAKDVSKEMKGKAETIKGKRNSKNIETVEKVNDKLPEVQKESTESRRTPGRPQRQAAKRAESQIKEIAANDEESQESDDHMGRVRVCDSCYKARSWVTSFKYQENGSETTKYFCSQDCAGNFKRLPRIISTNDVDANNANALDSARKFTRKCAQCSSVVSGDEKSLSWETMDYCNEECLGRYQKILGSQCANCKGEVAATSLGKYCVRFGYDVKQFCCSTCLEEFKKGLKVCSYCQKDISGGSEGFLAPVGDKGQFKDFCTQSCMEKYDQMSNNHPPPVVVQECAVCNHEKVVSMEVVHKKRESKFCSEPCFAAFRFVNGMVTDQCYMCKKFFDKKEVDNYAVYSDDSVHSFCSKTCMNVYILANRKIVPCHWCKVKKYNFDMIKRTLSTGQLLLVCSLNCLALYQVGVNATKRIKCDMCGVMNQPQYNLSMSDNTIRNFCNYQCVLQFQDQYANSACVDTLPVPTGVPKRYVPQRRSVPVQQNETQRDSVPVTKANNTAALPVISSVESLASDDPSNQNSPGITTRSAAALKQVNSNNGNNIPQTSVQPPKFVRQIIVRPPPPKQMRNKAVTCRPPSHTKGTHCRPIVCSKETQTTESAMGKPVLIPVPVPIYVPTPMCLYSSPFPVPVPFPLPVPVPIFIPTTRNSAKGIMKEITRIQEKIPTDPFEAELLMMAEIVAGDKKEENSDSDSDAVDNTDGETKTVAAGDAAGTNVPANEKYSPETVDTSNTFGDDMLQMALKMATELEEPTDLEAALTPSTITSQPSANVEQTNSESEDDPEPVQSVPEVRPLRGRKRAVRSQRSSTTPSTASKRRRVSASGDTPLLPPPEPPQPAPVELEKPDANMCLKFTLGVNAWKRWVLTKNAELEKAAASNRKLKLFKTEILQQTADELNYSLCLFVKEVRKPNSHEYAPDTIYYLCLGIQQYLFENGRIDNIFTDPYYEKFTECLDEVAKKFSTLYNDSQYIVTRVEEEHLWESKQLGAHSPHVLLSTLMFFNTKHFNLTTVEEHMQLSFSHIMKHWKRNPSQSGSSKGPGSSRNVLLRFYPPQSALEANSKKKKVYEQQENEENPLRCPVKLYEFYLSKCPESVKTRNDVFYLLPERSCVPDSPVWYSTMALGKEPLMKMLHRVKMVKEINQALLKS